ncbi:Leukotoxin [Defluviimonas aquaemixtae]|uniref:Leukotoxin n=1 Tax=Albidovulum aquaemixtae TaxID=1542388 RepID=A0A2R8B222_9RHOB|nr:calcium-binding protein [Defluviimonas aquaemixtae]SPH16585.1 Leukotoxin [Defluviimonas aquaemixtae]
MARGDSNPSSSGTPFGGYIPPYVFYNTIYASGGFTYGTPFHDIIYGTRGVDVVAGGAGSDIIYGYSGDDRIVGESGHDQIFAGIGDDWAFGGTGNDTIDGGSGDDRIAGDEGDDVLTGGSGVDKFEFTVGDGNDVVTDYEPGIDEFLFFAAYVNGPIDHSFTFTNEGILIEYGDQGDSVLLQGATFYIPGDFGFFH